jgi:hypothetical protein
MKKDEEHERERERDEESRVRDIGELRRVLLNKQKQT